MPSAVDLGRREFLFRSCQGLSAALLPACLLRLGRPLHGFDSTETSANDGEYHLVPHYRVPRPLDNLLLKSESGHDDFITEQYADQIAGIFDKWSAELLQSPPDLQTVKEALAPDFIGASLRPSESRASRPGSAIVVHRNTFTSEFTVARDAFLLEMQNSLSGFEKILVAEFQVTSIDVGPVQSSNPKSLTMKTRIRYEFVGSGSDFYREQCVGHWLLTWERPEQGDFRVRTWLSLDETRSRSKHPAYVDVTAAALGSNSSYSAQLLHGTDYWRTVLDGACGIDIYGHNGVSIGDIDGDGFDDLYVCQPGGLPNRLYRNRGDGTFEDITDSAGVGVLENTACALLVDVDNDGRQDLIVVRANGPMLFLNEGGGKFRQKANAFQFSNPPQGTFTGAAVADYDRDGWLDIYFCLYVYYQGTDQYKYPAPYYDAENGPPNFMMRNNRDGTFSDVTAQSGLNQNNTRYSFCCAWNDFNRDGWPDLYVVNDFGRKNLYRNNGDGTFTDVAPRAGVEDIGAGMSVSWFDYNNDGVDDLYVANMWTAAGERISMQDMFQKNAASDVRMLYHQHAMGNSLFKGRFKSAGGDTPATPNQAASRDFAFDDATDKAGVGIGRWAWSSDAWDFDHDGYADLYITNGMVSGSSRNDLNSFFWRQVVNYSPNEAKSSSNYEQGWSAINELIRADGTWSGYERNIFYANNGDGTFSDISGTIGLDFLEDGRAFALTDLDHDGRQEILLKNRNGPQLRILKNVMEDLPPSIAFHLRGTKSNRDAIGAVVTLTTEWGTQTRSLQAGSGFLSQHSKDIFFGLGNVKGPVRASIRWPSGLFQELQNLPIAHRVWVEEGTEHVRAQAFDVLTGDKPAEAIRNGATEQANDTSPQTIETWLLAPIQAPDFALPDLLGQTVTLSSFRGKPVLVHLWSPSAELPEIKTDWATFNQRNGSWAAQGLHLLSVTLDNSPDVNILRSLVRAHDLRFTILRGTDDIAAVYNIVYRYLFDRHRDLTLPTSFLVSGSGEIVKLYQGPVAPDHVDYDFQHIPTTTSERLARALPFAGLTDAIDFGRNYLSYGSIFFQRGYMDQAAASFHVAQRDDPASAEAVYGLGSVYLEQQKAAEARASFKQALKLRASYPDTMANSWNNLGLLSAREGNREDAIGYFKRALELSPDHLIALNNLGSAYRQQKMWTDARKTYDRALHINSNDAEANYGMGMVLAQNGDNEAAFNFLQKALSLRPVYPEALNNLGILYLRTQRRDQAVATFEECIRIAPSFDQSYLNLARVYALEQTPDKARSILDELLKQHPGLPQAMELLNQLGNK